MRLACVLVAGLLVSPATQGMSLEKESWLKTEAQEAIKATLKDPDSAKFTDVRLAKEEYMAVCGKVNSKNGFGGYVGAQRFISNGREMTVTESQMDKKEFRESWKLICG